VDLCGGGKVQDNVPYESHHTQNKGGRYGILGGAKGGGGGRTSKKLGKQIKEDRPWGLKVKNPPWKKFACVKTGGRGKKEG